MKTKSKKIKKVEEQISERVLHLNLSKQNSYPDNSIRSAKYTPLTFLPANIAIQVSKPSNLYFICLGILQTVRSINPDGLPTIFFALLIVMSISIVKDFIENLKSWKSDKQENNQNVVEYINYSFQKSKSMNLKVGSIVKVF